jgi:hypothetical protein
MDSLHFLKPGLTLIRLCFFCTSDNLFVCETLLVVNLFPHFGFFCFQGPKMHQLMDMFAFPEMNLYANVVQVK